MNIYILLIGGDAQFRAAPDGGAETCGGELSYAETCSAGS